MLSTSSFVQQLAMHGLLLTKMPVLTKVNFVISRCACLVPCGMISQCACMANDSSKACRWRRWREWQHLHKSRSLAESDTQNLSRRS